MSKHKHYDMIRQWIEDTSRPVECRRPGGGWSTLTTTPVWDESVEYRFADSVLKYRVALFEDGGGSRWTVIANNAQDEEALCQATFFIKWITDWTEVTDPPVETPKPKMKKYEVWVNLFDDGTVSFRRSQEEAYRSQGSTRSGCRHIEWEVPA